MPSETRRGIHRTRSDRNIASQSLAVDPALLLAVGRLKRAGGLFGGEYARFMSGRSAAPTTAAVSANTATEDSAQDGTVARARLGEPPGAASARLDPAVFVPGDGAGQLLDRRPAQPNDALFIEVGNPANPRLRREWEKANGRPWPRDLVDGRKYHVGHRKALADGGTNTLDNIEPIHPDAHLAQHRANGDFARWARRAAIARAFGGTVSRSLGAVNMIPNITGILSGRIRTDSFDNFSSDFFGWPSQADKREQFEREQKKINPNWKWGDTMTFET